MAAAAIALGLQQQKPKLPQKLNIKIQKQEAT
jgi:hypothetical protein